MLRGEAQSNSGVQRFKGYRDGGGWQQRREYVKAWSVQFVMVDCHSPGPMARREQIGSLLGAEGGRPSGTVRPRMVGS